MCTHGKEDKELYFVHNARLTDNRKHNNKADKALKAVTWLQNGKQLITRYRAHDDEICLIV